MALPLEQRKSIIERLQRRHVWAQHEVFKSHIDQVASETQISSQQIEGETFTTLFLTHSTIPKLYKNDPEFSLKGTARFFKSITVDGADNLVSLGMPHFFSVDDFTQSEPFLALKPGFRYVEKHDGTCLLVTKWRERYLIRSRRKIYGIYVSLDCLNFGEYELGPKLQALLERAGEPATAILEAIFPHPALRKVTLAPFYQRVMHGAGFSPFVDYPSQDAMVTGLVYHNRFAFERQEILDTLCADLGLRRSRTLAFENFELAQDWLKKKTNHEGFCVYSEDGQVVFKFKTRWYFRVRNTTGEVYRLVHGQ